MNMVQACQYMSDLTKGKRSTDFFHAWMVEEHGWVNTVPNNNPANISGPINRKYPWFKHAVKLASNNAVIYDTLNNGCIATIQLLSHYYPHVLSAKTDGDAIRALGEPDIFGGHWASNPKYAQQIQEIYNELKKKSQPTHVETPPLRAVVAVHGVTVEQVQGYLKRLGYYAGNIDGIIGPLTTKAVLDFQEHEHIAKDAIVGTVTWTHLQQQMKAVTAPKKVEPVYHDVIAGDTLSEIAAKNGLTLAEIEKLNPDITNPNLIVVGQKVRVK